MKKLIPLLVILIVITLSSCVTTTSTTAINKISIGMSKSQVISTLGEPKDSRANDRSEYLIYGLHHMNNLDCYLNPNYCEHDYFIKLNNGKVISYGRVGDFDSTKTPEATINVKQN